MTIKKRLFFSNILMLIIPALVSVLMIALSALLFINIFYKQFMDESVNQDNLSLIHELLVEQSKEFLCNDTDKDVKDTRLYRTVEKYLTSQEMKLEIYDGSDVVCSLGSSGAAEDQLIKAMAALDGEGSVIMKDACLYGERIIVNDKPYRVLIYSSVKIKESQRNESLVAWIAVLVSLLIIAAVIVTNRFLTKFVIKRIEAPLDILTEGVHHIRDGNLDYRIEYSGSDEFRGVCEDFNDMAAKLKESVEITQKNEQSRKELIAGISHDLRTPLTSIKAYIEGLIEGVASTPQMQQKYMKTIQAKADDIDKMVDKLFLFSKLDLGDCPFYPEKLNLGRELSSLVSANEKEYHEKGMNITLEPVDDELFVYADPIQLRSAVTNILENSLKYKDGETVDVNIRCKALEDHVAIAIEDNGPGVSEEALPKLFDVFYRSDPSRNNPQKGSGLGLAITAKILERFGGSVSAENADPKGLRVILNVPKEEKHE